RPGLCRPYDRACRAVRALSFDTRNGMAGGSGAQIALTSGRLSDFLDPVMPHAQYRIGAPYHAIARHPEERPDNKMHEDGLPQQLGFRGAFVLGVALYGYMTRALVASLGEAWLGRAVIDVKFL